MRSDTPRRRTALVTYLACVLVASVIAEALTLVAVGVFVVGSAVSVAVLVGPPTHKHIQQRGQGHR